MLGEREEMETLIQRWGQHELIQTFWKRTQNTTSGGRILISMSFAAEMIKGALQWN